MDPEEVVESWIWSTWAKTPVLEGAEVLVAAACLPIVNPDLYRELSKGRVVLFACPERESPAHYGKLASMMRSTKPKKIVVVTIDGSPHCFTLQASLNEAEYILGEEVPREHYVLLDGRELKKISPDAIRVARYLSIVEEVLENNPEVLEKLRHHSKEYRLSLRFRNDNKGQLDH